MKTLLLLSSLTMFPAALTLSGEVPLLERRSAGGQNLDVRDIASQARISLREAIQKSLVAQPGRAVEAELEGERTEHGVDVFFEVLVLDGEGELVEIRLSPVDGKVLSREEAEGDEDEIPEFASALRHGERNLEQLVAAAEAFVKGVPVKVSLEFEDRSPLAEVAFVNGRNVIEVEVEGRAGHLVGLAMAAEEQEKLGEGAADEDEAPAARSEER
ncbi:MAG: PepSY domain-containing protein [Planctomycetota bacterium]